MIMIMLKTTFTSSFMQELNVKITKYLNVTDLFDLFSNPRWSSASDGQTKTMDLFELGFIQLHVAEDRFHEWRV